MLQQSSHNSLVMTDQRWKPSFEIAPNCPRCASTNTKFCYYNNYSLSQPRYFCKGCRRYWTKGGSLRNVPVGGGCRRNRRGKAVRIQRSSFVQQQERTSHETVSPSISSNGTDVSSGSDIDLAVVFSKFLNQDLNSDPGTVEAPEVMNSVEANYGSPAVQFPQQGSSGCFKDTSVMDGREHIFSEQFDFASRHPEERITDGFSGSDSCSYRLQAGLLNDGFLEDDNEYLWSQAAPSVPNFSWQEAAFPGFDEIVSEDPATSYPNLLLSNWSSIA